MVVCFKGCAWGVRFVDRHIFEDSWWLGEWNFFSRPGGGVARKNCFLHIGNPDEIMRGPRPAGARKPGIRVAGSAAKYGQLIAIRNLTRLISRINQPNSCHWVS